MNPVLCIGESKEEYEAGLNHEICAIQILRDLTGVSPEDMSKVIIACKFLRRRKLIYMNQG